MKKNKAVPRRRKVKRDPPPVQVRFTSAAGVEVRPQSDDGLLDEVVTTRGPVDVHLERMDDGHIWMCVGDVTVNLWTVAGDTIYGRAERYL